jgi:uncharacterized protein YqgC (DUF456 family)
MVNQTLPWIVWTLSVVCVVVGLLGTIVPILPGAPLIFVGVLIAAWWEDFSRVGFFPVIITGSLAGITILVDIASSYLGAKRAGASTSALIGSIIGSLIGMFFLLPGLILGPFIGALVGEWWNGRNLSQATRVGMATWIGMLIGTAAKVGIAIAMVGVFILALLT